MGITGNLKEIRPSTLETLRQDPAFVGLLLDAQYLPETEIEFRQFPELQAQFAAEWETPELDLDKYVSELTFLLAGYIPGYISSSTTIAELRANSELMAKAREKDFIPFLVIENSEWDELPLVNAVGAGTEIGHELGYGKARYLLPDEVTQVLNGLAALGEEGFQERLSREAENGNVQFDLGEEIQEYLLEYYNEMLNYYQETSARQNAMLLYLL